jgi:hypothetical protein
MTDAHPGIAAHAEFDAGKARLLFSIRCGYRARQRPAHEVGQMHATSGGYLLRAGDLRVVDLPLTYGMSHHFLYWPYDQVDDVGYQSVALHCARCSDRHHNTWWRYLVRDLVAAARTPGVDYVYVDVRAGLIPVAPGGTVGVLKHVCRRRST